MYLVSLFYRFFRLAILLPLLPQVVEAARHLKGVPVHIWRALSEVRKVQGVFHHNGPLMLEEQSSDISVEVGL